MADNTYRTTEVELPGDAVRPLIERAEASDGVAAFSEQFLAGLDDARLAHTHIVCAPDDDPGLAVGVAAVDQEGSVELVVDPGRRRLGAGSALVDEVRRRFPQAGFWAHGNLPAARELARTYGLEPRRELLVMQVDGPELDAAAEFRAPAGFDAVTYTDAVQRWGREAVEAGWLEANNSAFNWHPEQGGWDVPRLHRAMEAEWFDPEGVWLLNDGDRVAGFHWTKRHPDGTGEVYVVGLHSDYRGRGLGDPLLRVGLHHLREGGAEAVKLYVEADNAPAVRRYELLGFSTVERHVVYSV